MVIRMHMAKPPNIGEEYVFVKYESAVTRSRGYWYYYPNDLKKWHGYVQDPPYYGERFGVRMVLSVEGEIGKWKVKVSKDLYPDHP